MKKKSWKKSWKKNRIEKAIKVDHAIKKSVRNDKKIIKKIKIKVIDNPLITTINHYNTLNPNAPIGFHNNDNFLLRLTINYIRHNLSNYDQLLSSLTYLQRSRWFKDEFNYRIFEKYNNDLLREKNERQRLLQPTI